MKSVLNVRPGAIIVVVLWAASVANAIPFASDQIGLTQVRLSHPSLDGVSDVTGQPQRVAIIDTGIDWANPALAGRVVEGVNYAANALWGTTTPSDYVDRNGHGTFVSGIVGSSDAQITGMAPDVEFVSVRVLAANGGGITADVISGLQWVVNNAARLNITTVNMSLGSYSTWADQALLPVSSETSDFARLFGQLKAMDIVTLVASGNDSSTTGMALPAVFDDVVSVGAVNDNDTIWHKTNRNEELELLAPGQTIHSLWINGREASSSGTSFATGFATGAAVLIRELIEQFDADLSGEYDTFQDRFVDLVQATGLSVHDPVTGLDFARLDLGRAIGAVEAQYRPAPEPAAFALMACGLAMFCGRARRQAAS